MNKPQTCKRALHERRRTNTIRVRKHSTVRIGVNENFGKFDTVNAGYRVYTEPRKRQVQKRENVRRLFVRFGLEVDCE